MDESGADEQMSKTWEPFIVTLATFAMLALPLFMTDLLQRRKSRRE